MRLAALLLPSLLLTGACKQRDTSPPTLDELSHDLVRDFEDPELLGEHVATLHDWLDVEGRDDAAWDGLLLTNLTADDLTDPLPTDADLTLHRGVATAAVSPFPIEAHADLIVSDDQTALDPGSFDLYDRSLLEGDAAVFAGGSGVVRTDNDVIKRGAFGVTIPYAMRKDYRWVETEDGTRSIVGRGWLEERGCNEAGNNCVNQSWALEAFVEHEGETCRLYAVWLEVVTQADGLLSEDAKIGLIAKGNQDIIEGTDEALAEQ